MKESTKVIIAIVFIIVLFSLFIITLLFLPLLSDKLEYAISGDSPMHACESRGGVYNEASFEPRKCYIREDIYEIYYLKGEYRLAK